MSDTVLSISQLTRKIRNLLEIQIGEVQVEGEISNLRLQRSGHCYFTLKDESAQLAAVLFKGRASKLAFQPKDGMMVLARGDISVYEAQGKYQLVVASIQEAGVGALQARFEALKRKLQAEGLFDQDRKQSIPRFPETIALVTSSSGAALQDMLNILRRRAPWVRVLLLPVAVQGKAAAGEITKALDFLDAESNRSLPRIDTVIVGRGGGSLEDLWPFNEEAVGRAVARCSLPVISAVGHETDFTICDFAADLRAPTPSAAAELAVPDGTELRRYLAELNAKAQRVVKRHLEHAERLLAMRSRESLRRSPEFALREAGQRLDSLADALQSCARNKLNQLRTLSQHHRDYLRGMRPERILTQSAENLSKLRRRLNAASLRELSRNQNAFEQTSHLLHSLSPKATLQRGFSMTFEAESGKLLKSAHSITPGTRLRTTLADGEVDSTATSGETD